MMFFFLTCLYIAFYYIRPTEWVPGLIGVQIFNVFGIICVFALLLSVLLGKIRLLKGNEEMMMVGFVAAVILSNARHTYLQGIINSITTLLPIFVGYFLMCSAITSRDKYNNFVLLLISLTTFLAYEGWLQHTTGVAHGGMRPVVEVGIGQDGALSEIIRICWYGVFADPNDLGLALVIAIPFLMNMALHRKFLVPGLSLPIIAMAIYFTNSRGAFIALFVAVSSFFVIYFRSKSGVFIGALLALVLSFFAPSRMGQLSGQESSAHGRLEAWHQGFQMFKANPLFGVGQGMYLEFHNQTAHNSFVLVMAELGLVGLFFFTGLFYFPLNWLWRNLFLATDNGYNKSDVGLFSAVFSSLLGMMAAMYFLSRTYMLIPYILFVLATASTRICVPVSGGIAEAPPLKLHLKNVALITALEVIVLNITVKFFI